jgi:hypothetical protein
MWSALPKAQKCVVTLRKSLCGDTHPLSPPVAVTAGGVSLLNCKNILYLIPYSPKRYTTVALLHLRCKNVAARMSILANRYKRVSFCHQTFVLQSRIALFSCTRISSM